MKSSGEIDCCCFVSSCEWLRCWIKRSKLGMVSTGVRSIARMISISDSYHACFHEYRINDATELNKVWLKKKTKLC